MTQEVTLPAAGARAVTERSTRRCRVLVTRAPEQAGELCTLLAAHGFEPISAPVVAPRLVRDTNQIDGALRRLDRYAWIVFSSANAVRFFFERLAALSLPATCGAARVVCGPATATALREHGVEPDLIVEPYGAERAAEEMAAHVRANEWVLLPRAEGGQETLAANLTALGARVDDVILYQTEGEHQSALDAARLVREGAVDAVTFFSPSAVRSFCTALATICGHMVSQPDLGGVAIACIGPTTAAAAAAIGLKVDVVSNGTTALAMAQTLAGHFQIAGQRS